MDAYKITSNGVEYPVAINMYVLKEFELSIGLKMSQMGELVSGPSEASGMIEMAKLIYFGAKRAAKKTNAEFSLTDEDFIEGIKVSDFNSVALIFKDALAIGKGEAENNRQPVKSAK